MSLESASAAAIPFHHHPHHQQQSLHRPHGPSANAMVALKLAAAASFLSSDSTTSNSSSTFDTGSPARQPALHPITTTIPNSIHACLESPHPRQLEQHPKHAQAPPQNARHQTHISSLPSPPLSSIEPAFNSGFFPKSPLQDRCDALETELSALRSRLKRAERTSVAREKRLSMFQQKSTDTQQSIHTLKLQYESVLTRLQDTQYELAHVKDAVSTKDERIQQLEAAARDQECNVAAILADRDALSTEMKESHADNAKQSRKLQASTDKVEKLLHENRQLIEQLQELRTRASRNSEAHLQTERAPDQDGAKDDKRVADLRNETTSSKTEVDRLQGLVLMMSNRHVQLQAQLTFFQQQSQQLQKQLEDHLQAAERTRSQDNSRSSRAVTRMSTSASSTATATCPASKHSSLMFGDGVLAALLTSVASSASTAGSRRAKPTRRFTVNAPRKEGELTMEQRKCEFLMDQITVLQRGYDTLRQEKVTLELQLDLMQRQHQYHQQQRQKRRDSQRRTLGYEQSAALSNALVSMVPPASASAAVNVLATIPSTPLLPTISAAEQEREKARIQLELEQAQIRAQKEAQEKVAKRLAAKAAAEEAEREAYRLKRAKSMHLKETLASLESKRERTDSSTIQFSISEELKHLEHLRLAGEQQSSLLNDGGMPSPSAASSAAAAAMRASRRLVSPFGSSQHTSATTSPLLSAFSSPSPLSSVSSSRHKHYTHSSQPNFTIEQCSCCIGPLIEL
ncbi:hypothetical protein KVV02_001355 [Mortierella alpina]|uniref:Uncharacterized protein n=1 Tax=Mortierella alpina TaxID=64518 RepID=A0A9P8CYH2_MORAP|nr:hypothetical protein KVV02_001355 [Mortierella alpina]